MQSADPNKPALRFRKLRIAWSVVCGALCVLLVLLSIHTSRNQVKGATWISKSHYISFVAFRHWVEADVERPNWEPHGYFHSNYVANPDPLTSPPRRWHLGPLTQTGSAWRVAIRIPLWLLVVLSTVISALPWSSTIASLRRFSLRSLLVATTLVAVALGAIVLAARK
jgi:hypothetical protein